MIDNKSLSYIDRFNRLLIREYLKYGSVDEAVKRNHFDLPVSYAHYQRILDGYGVVKAAGPNNKLTEAIHFFESLAKDNIRPDQLYRKMPLSFQTSIKTLYRIYAYMKEGITRRVGVALVISPYDDPCRMLLAEDVSTPRLELGKTYGSLSLPMGYSRKRDSRKSAIKRILQNEVFTQKVVNRTFPDQLIADNFEPFMYLDIADVRVAAYRLILPKNLSSISSFSSFKLRNYHYRNLDELLTKKDGLNLRTGVGEIARGYQKYLQFSRRNLKVNPLQVRSWLNRELATIRLEVE